MFVSQPFVDSVAEWMRSVPTDFVLKSTDGVEVDVHRAFVARRAPMLIAQTDVHSTRLQVNLTGAVLKALVHYIYRDRVEASCDAFQLVVAAKHLQVDRLVEICTVAIVDNLTTDNVYPTFASSKLLELPMLQLDCEKFMETHKGDIVAMLSAIYSLRG